MARVGFLVNNKLTAGTLVGSGGFSTGLPIANALTPRPGEVAAASAGPAPLLLGRFQIQTSGGDGENRKIDVQITSGAFVGVYAVELPIAGEYNADTLAAALQAELRSQTGETTWIVAWVAWGKFAIQANESWVLLGATGASIATNILGELNYPATDVTYAAGDVAFSGTRWGTTAWAHWEVADADFPAALAVLQSSLADDAPTADFSDARVYISANWYGTVRSRWVAEVALGNAEVFQLSPAGARHATNPVHMDTRTTGTAARHVFFIWRFFDSAREHHVGFVGLMEALTSTTRQVAPIRRLGRESGSGVLATDYYPAPRKHRIGVELRLADWSWASDYSTVAYPVELLGTQSLVGLVVNYSDIVSGDRLAEEEADRELFFIASLSELPERSLGGIDDSRASAPLRFLQVV